MILSIRGVTLNRGHAVTQDLEAFQRHVSDRFSDLAGASPEELLSLPWVGRLLEAFLSCQEEFRGVLSRHRAEASRAPAVADFFERSVKALDVCNAIRDGIEQVRQWLKLLDIVTSALGHNKPSHSALGEGHFRRAAKALIDLAIGMLDDKDSTSHQHLLAHRNRSFGKLDSRSLCHFRSLSWSVSRSWSAARQLQAIGSNLRGSNDPSGIGMAVYTMGSILLLVMWVLVAAIPCQDRGLQVHFCIPRHFAWASSVYTLHDRILEESKRRDRRNACGLLREIHQMDKCSRLLNELADSVQFPLSEDKAGEVRERVEELARVSQSIKQGLDPLERQVRQVFHRIVLSRTEGLDSMGRVNAH